MAVSNTAEIIKIISDELFKAEFRRLDGEVTRISRLNREAVPTVNWSFMYNGKVYQPSDSPTIKSGPGSSTGLAFSLTPVMEDYLSDLNTVMKDKKQIEMMLYKLIYQCIDIQEVRDALPDCLVSLVPQLERIPRKLNQLFLIRHDERTLRQFEAILPTMEFYSVSRLMY
uniref:Uncharacterized protein n=1 Tax=Pseudomonas phage Arace01 TaxID=3138526 RepID=A0AAU6VZJ5_9VIRU